MNMTHHTSSENMSANIAAVIGIACNISLFFAVVLLAPKLLLP